MSVNNIATQEMLKALKTQIMKEQFDEKYPVGSGHYIQFQGMSEPDVAFAKYGATWTRDNDYAGRVLVGSGTRDGVTYAFGTTGGSADAVVVEHFHTNDVVGIVGGEASVHGGFTMNNRWNWIQSEGTRLLDSYGAGVYNTGTKGVSGVGKNMQPYKVVAVWKRTA